MAKYDRSSRRDETKATLCLRVPPDPRYVVTVRHAILGFAALHDVTDEDVQALLFAVGEALANAIEHGSHERDIEIFAEVENTRLTATVVDHGDGLPATPAADSHFPEGLVERGRGFPIMQRYADKVNVRTRPGAGTAVTLVRERQSSKPPMRAQENELAL
jgi:stage II sporulation protein AB (anti-sigma F factor)